MATEEQRLREEIGWSKRYVAEQLYRHPNTIRWYEQKGNQVYKMYLREVFKRKYN